VNALLLLVLACAARQERAWSASVGMPVSVHDLVLPGAELRALEGERGAPLVLRVDAVRPHGDRFRYDLVFYALEPGDYDLARCLRRADGSAATDLPPLAFHVQTLLPPGQVEPHRPEPGWLPSLGGYRVALVAAGVAWLAGLVLLVRAGRRAREREIRPALRAVTLEERLAPLIAAARADGLGPAGRAELERVLIAWWRRRLGLEQRDGAAALAELAVHPEAGPLLAGLEQWLHRPDAPAVDLEALLAPYRELERAAPAPERGP